MKRLQKKLEKLQKTLEKTGEALVINPNDSDTWGSDTLYDLAEQLKETLQLLEDQKSKQLDEFGEPIILEEGILSLLEDWQNRREEYLFVHIRLVFI